ncbi:MAG: tetratricopeptide repeat protein [Myxococcales bacterium]
MAEKHASSRKERSDLFKVEEPTPSLAPVEKIVLPPEEALKRRIRRLIAAAIAAVIFLYLIHVALGLIHDARVDSALDEVINDASPDTIDTALALLRDNTDPSVRARLLAMAGLGGDHEKLEEAEQILASSAKQNDPDQRIAKIYAFLAEGDARAAHAEAERPAKYTNQADAFLLARARSAIARGQWDQALADAQTVVASRPGAPEPAALLARITARTEGADAALAVLGRVSDPTPASEIERARITGLLQDEREEGISLADQVLADDDATVVQKAWAHLIEGVLAYRRGAIGLAYEQTRAAAEPVLRVDEVLVLEAAQVFLALRRTGDAKQLLSRLSSGPSADLFMRTHVIAWWYAQTGDMRAGLATLEGAGYGQEKEAKPAFRALVLAELLRNSRRNADRERAKSLYREAAADRDWGVVASNALASWLLEEGDAQESLAVLTAALGAHPHHLTLVDTAAQAYLEQGRVDEAEKVTRSALQAFPNEGWAYGSHARVLLAKRDFAEALGALDRAVELSPDDARLYALRGDAAHAVGSIEAAEQSYQKSLEIDPNEPRALSGLVASLIDTGNFERAEKVIEQMDQAKVRDLRADEERIRYLVRIGAGQAGVRTMRSAVSRHSKNVDLRLAGARVYIQAEDYRRAGVYFQKAKRDGANPRLADTALALMQMYSRRKLGAENSLERAAEATDAEGNPLSAGPQVRVWELIVKARIALADDKRGLAVRYARQAEDILPGDPDLSLLEADIEEDRDRSPEEALREAANAAIPLPVAAGRLAMLLGPTEEGCQMAARYLRANRATRLANRVRDIYRQCE